MGGIIGRIFNEFAVVVTVAICASAFVSLTLTPMLAAKILRTPEKDEKQPRWSVRVRARLRRHAARLRPRSEV